MTTTTKTLAKPMSDEQQAHRKGFGLIAKLSSDLKAAHEIGLHKESLRQKGARRKPTTFSCFKHLNRDCFGADGIDYQRVVVSKGPLAKPDITSARLDADGMLTVTFCNRYYDGDPDDELIIVAYSPRWRGCLLAGPVPRSAEALTAQLPAEWLQASPDIHLYAFFRGKKLHTSDSVYIALADGTSDPINEASDPINGRFDPIKGSSDPINELGDPINGQFDPINELGDPINGQFDPINEVGDPINELGDPINEVGDPINEDGDPINIDPINASLYRLIRQDGTLSYAGYAQRLGVSETTVKRHLQALKSQGLILRLGSNKTGRWELPA